MESRRECGGLGLVDVRLQAPGGLEVPVRRRLRAGPADAVVLVSGESRGTSPGERMRGRAFRSSVFGAAVVVCVDRFPGTLATSCKANEQSAGWSRADHRPEGSGCRRASTLALGNPDMRRHPPERAGALGLGAGPPDPPHPRRPHVPAHPFHGTGHPPKQEAPPRGTLRAVGVTRHPRSAQQKRGQSRRPGRSVAHPRQEKNR